MKKGHLIITGFLAVLCSSCYSYKIYPKAYRNLENDLQKRRAFVENTALKKELHILDCSEIFEITSDSTKADVRVRLYPMEQLFVCGQPVAVSLLTLGQIPVILPDRYLYRFDEMEKGNVTTRSFELTIAQRIWFWDILSWNKKFEEKTGKAVLGAYRAVARENVVN